MSELIKVTFEGTYRAPHPDGHTSLAVTRKFRVSVKMKREEALKADGMRGIFATYYTEHVKRKYADMTDLYMFSMVEATELDGKKIPDPKAMSHDDLLDYIRKKRLPINPLLYAGVDELRNQVVLFEKDPAGQQFLQGKLQDQKGNMLLTAAELQQIEDLVVVEDIADEEEVDEEDEDDEPASTKSVGELLGATKKK